MKSNSPIDLSNMESKIIRFFFEHVEQELYEKEIADQAGVSAGAANKYLKLLSEKSLLLHRKAGRMNFYKLNKDEPLVKQMKKTYTLSMPFIIKMKEHIKETKIEVYIYGSAARGEDTEKSDIDLLIIGNINNAELEKKFSPIRKTSKKEIKTNLFTRLEWLSMSKKDPAFFERVEKDKIRLV